MPIPPGQPFPLQIMVGPDVYLTTAIMAEGEPYEAGTVVGDGSYFTTLWLGGHDGSNKLVGGGFQVITNPPTFVAPAGSAVVDQTGVLWLSNGQTWSPISGGGGGGGPISPPPGTVSSACQCDYGSLWTAPLPAGAVFGTPKPRVESGWYKRRRPLIIPPP